MTNHTIPKYLSADDYNAESKEYLIFDSLKENLTDEYYVFHSVKSSFDKKVKTKNGFKYKTKEAEADFVIYNSNKVNGGLIVVEAKYIEGFSITDGEWYDKKGNKIHYGSGPYEQVRVYTNFLKDFIHQHLPSVEGVLPITYIVWFHKMSNTCKQSMNNISDTELHHTLFKEDLDNPLKSIEGILKNQTVHEYDNRRALTNEEDKILQRLLNANADVFDAKAATSETDHEFTRLLNEQISILDFLEEQQIACIQGLGGTGKTVVAVKKAERCSLDGKTLFLCYNSELRKYLANKYAGIGVDFLTLDELTYKAGSMLKIENPTYSCLDEYVLSNSFEYKHIIVDECQDFGRDQGINVDNRKIINNFFDALRLNSDLKQGSLFLFYDKYQCIQSNYEFLPEIIKSPECLLTLHTNCRNTKNIAQTSIGALSRIYNLKLHNNKIKGIEGNQSSFYRIKNSDELDTKIKLCLNQLINNNICDIVILTLDKLETTILNNSDFYSIYSQEGVYKYANNDRQIDIPVKTVRKFKGLEADAVIIVDVDENTFNLQKSAYNNPLLNFYVATSRAKIELNIIGTIDDSKLADILNKLYNYEGVSKPTKQLMQIINTKLK